MGGRPFGAIRHEPTCWKRFPSPRFCDAPLRDALLWRRGRHQSRALSVRKWEVQWEVKEGVKSQVVDVAFVRRPEASRLVRFVEWLGRHKGDQGTVRWVEFRGSRNPHFDYCANACRVAEGNQARCGVAPLSLSGLEKTPP